MKSIKKIPVEADEQENGKLKFLSEEDTEVHINNIMNDYEDIYKGKYQNFEDLVFSYAIKIKGSIVQASTFLYSFLAVIIIELVSCILEYCKLQ